MKRWFSLSVATVMVLLAPLPAFAQVVVDPYKKAGPAGAEQEFIATRVDQPKATETLAKLRELYVEAAKYYAVDSDGHVYLRYNLDGSESGYGKTGVPLTWTSFGAALKSGQILLIRLTETPPGPVSNYAPAPVSQIVEYTVRWQPASANSADAAPPSTEAASSDSSGSKKLFFFKKTAAAIVAYMAILHTQEDAFIKAHGDFRANCKSLDAISKKVTAEKAVPAPADIADFNSTLDNAIATLEKIGSRNLQATSAKHGPGETLETEDAKVIALKISKQLQDLKKQGNPATPADN